MPTFSIMHGLGNCFAIVDGLREPDQVAQAEFGALSIALCKSENTLRLDGVIVISGAQELAVQRLHRIIGWAALASGIQGLGNR